MLRRVSQRVLTPVTITLDEARGLYVVDGVDTARVSAILKAAGLGADYTRVAPAVLENARDRGRYVDECCDALDQGDLAWDRVHPADLPYVRGWEQLVRAERFTPARHQEPLCHRALGYAGTPDVIGPRAGRLWVVDRKCTYELALGYRVQLAAYAVALCPEAPETVGRAVAWLKPDGPAEWVPYDDPDDFACWTAALGAFGLLRVVEAWKTRHAKRRRRAA
jgi:hypothetical protein